MSQLIDQMINTPPVFQRSLVEDKGVGPWLLALFIFVVCGSGESSSV